MYTIRYLDARIDQEDELSENLRQVMAAMVETMENFGSCQLRHPVPFLHTRLFQVTSQIFTTPKRNISLVNTFIP
jgi:hypothetical protein